MAYICTDPEQRAHAQVRQSLSLIKRLFSKSKWTPPDIINRSMWLRPWSSNNQRMLQTYGASNAKTVPAFRQEAGFTLTSYPEGVSLILTWTECVHACMFTAVTHKSVKYLYNVLVLSSDRPMYYSGRLIRQRLAILRSFSMADNHVQMAN